MTTDEIKSDTEQCKVMCTCAATVTTTLNIMSYARFANICIIDEQSAIVGWLEISRSWPVFDNNLIPAFMVSC